MLVPTDFFQPADHALAYADSLAAAIGAQLVLLHVTRDSVLDPEQLTGALAPLDKEATDLAFASLVRDLAVPAVAETAHGRVVPAIVAALGRHQPALAVLGRPDTDTTPDELVSTTALDLLRAAPHPMLVVPRHAPAATLPRRVLLAADAEAFTLGDYAGGVRHLFNALHSQLTVLHVGPTADADAATAAVTRTGLTIDLPPPKTRHLIHAVPAEGILQVAASGDFDLVVLVARPRSFLGELFHRSVTAQVLLHSPLPVLVLV